METSEEDINKLKKAKAGDIVILCNGIKVRYEREQRFNSCQGCFFKHFKGCYCQDHMIWAVSV